MDWHYARNGQQQGPINEQALRQMLAAGEVLPTDLVWRQDMAQWVPASIVPELVSPPQVAPQSVPAATPQPAAAAAQPSVYFAGGMMVPVPVETGKAKGLAMAALILGWCGLIPVLGILCGLVAVVLGIIALVRGTSRKYWAVHGIVTGLILSLIGMLVVAVLVPPMTNVRKLAQATNCAANLNALGKGIQLYQGDNHEQFPPSLAVLEKEEHQSPSIMRCATSGEPYFYYPPKSSAPDTRNLAATQRPYEPKPNLIIVCELHVVHPNGRNWLTADFVVHFGAEVAFTGLLAQPENKEFAKAFRTAGGD